jgi:hypothetical protein
LSFYPVIIALKVYEYVIKDKRMGAGINVSKKCMWIFFGVRKHVEYSLPHTEADFVIT